MCPPYSPYYWFGQPQLPFPSGIPALPHVQVGYTLQHEEVRVPMPRLQHKEVRVATLYLQHKEVSLTHWSLQHKEVRLPIFLQHEVRVAIYLQHKEVRVVIPPAQGGQSGNIPPAQSSQPHINVPPGQGGQIFPPARGGEGVPPAQGGQSVNALAPQTHPESGEQLSRPSLMLVRTSLRNPGPSELRPRILIRRSVWLMHNRNTLHAHSGAAQR